jgi:phage baseplate assembly protein W
MDAGHYFGGDLQLGATGDLLAADGILESNQRILRRLLTNAGDYLWNPSYGAGLPQRIGMPLNEPDLATLVRSQIYREASVSQSPAPQVTSRQIANGIDMRIAYLQREQNQTATLSFEVTP